MKRCCRTCRYWMGEMIVRRKSCFWIDYYDLPPWVKLFPRLCLPTYGTKCEAWKAKEETK